MTPNDINSFDIIQYWYNQVYFEGGGVQSNKFKWMVMHVVHVYMLII